MTLDASRSEDAVLTRVSLRLSLLRNAMIAIAAIFHNVVLEQASVGNVIAIIGVLGASSILSSVALIRDNGHHPRSDVATAAALGDIVIWTILVYLTGAERSMLFFLVLLRVADMRAPTFRRLFVFGHCAIVCYILLLLYVATVERPIGQAAALVRVGLLYLANLYLAFTAKASHTVAAARRHTSGQRANFLANASHELRTPLNGVIGGTRLLESTDLNPAQRHHVTLVRASAEALLHLVDEILDVSKLEAGKLTIEPIIFSLRATLGETLRPLTPRADAKGLVLRLSVDDEVPDAIIADPVRLRQIVVNLLDNAIKFTEDGEIEVRATAAARDTNGIVLHLAVRDTGIGIRADRREAVFDAFTQADGSTTRTHGGSGLGLNISSRLAELMGGRLWLESEVGRGSTFHVTLRCRLAPPRAERQVSGLAGLTAFIAEPNHAHRAALVDMLDGWGMSTNQAESGHEVLSGMTRARDAGRPYDVLFLGIDLIDMDGLRVVERLRATNDFSGPIIMLMRAVARRGDRERCAELGVSAVLTRPFSQSEVFNAASVALARPTTAAPSLRPRRVLKILLVDDNAVSREVAISYLAAWGHGVIAVEDGTEALATLERDRFDVAILDIHMPGADGLQVAREIRRREPATGARLAIVAMTARALDGDRERCLAAGMDAYVAKPVRPERLFEALERVTGPAPDFDMALLDCAAGDSALLERITRLFLEHTPSARARLHDALARRDAGGIITEAHWLKGAVDNFPAAAAREAAARVEAFGRAGDFEGARAASATLDAELDRLSAALAAALARASR